MLDVVLCGMIIFYIGKVCVVSCCMLYLYFIWFANMVVFSNVFL